MSSNSDDQYYATRAAAERELSQSAPDPAVALIHAKLAERYECLVAGERAPRPTLHIVPANWAAGPRRGRAGPG